MRHKGRFLICYHVYYPAVCIIIIIVDTRRIHGIGGTNDLMECDENLSLLENAASLGELTRVLHRQFYINSLNRLRLHVARLYLHCGILHCMDI